MRRSASRPPTLELLMRTSPVLGLVAVLALSLTACGNGDDAKASKAIADSVVAGGKTSTGGLFKVSRKQADCIGDGLVDKIGTDRLQKYGLLTEDLKAGKSVTDLKMAAADAEKATDVVFGCADIESMIQSAMTKQVGTLPAAVRTCVDEALTEDTLRPVLVEVFKGDRVAATRSLTEPLQKCAATAR